MIRLKKYALFSALFLILCLLLEIVVSVESPHIIIIVADDYGWNDVGFHGSNQIPTPNIDALAYNGVILNSHYTQSVCTPSRAALLTGKYPMRLGIQGRALYPADTASLPKGKIMPEYFKELGYSTYLVGKWHMGYARWNDTPTYRGFDHHFGYFNGLTSYYDYLLTWTIKGVTYTGFDLWRDKEPAWDVVGKYATDAFTEYAVNTIGSHDINTPLFLFVSHVAPHSGNEGKRLEAPQETINKFKYIIDSNRRTYAAMVSKLDDSVGSIVQALDQKNMLQNSIILFLSDNGAPSKGIFPNWGSNYPLKGLKESLHEGGIRGNALIWSPLIVQNSRVSNELIHITDWFPTLYTAAGGDIGILDPEVDGLDQWSSLVYDLPSPRNDILINIDEVQKNAALRFNNWKMVVGPASAPEMEGYFGESGKEVTMEIDYNTSAIFNSPAAQSVAKFAYTPVTEDEYIILRNQATLHCLRPKAKKNPCNSADEPACLYDIPSDPCEENNLYQYFPSVVRRMKRALIEYREGMSEQLELHMDIEKADPKFFQYIWNPWLDCVDSTCRS